MKTLHNIIFALLLLVIGTTIILALFGNETLAKFGITLSILLFIIERLARYIIKIESMEDKELGL